MRLSQYHRCEIALVTLLALHGYCFRTTRMKPRQIARLQGCGMKAVYRSIGMAEKDKLIARNWQGEVRLTETALAALREGFNGLDGKRREVVGAR